MEEPDRVSAPLQAVRDALTEPRTLTLGDVAAATGVDAQVLGALFEASGRLRERYGDHDLTYARALHDLLELIPASVLERAG
ncbi:MAG TPA: hypothetical protein VGA36_00175, partial [Nitriliruptorales bacterium]